ncbi:MAG: sulfatase-like hydrolase/transferase [Gammaproteobacteria bacterium]|nr:sulfatase-like hydrolase/transferase [Gammaproteobacteria bacterium]
MQRRQFLSTVGAGLAAGCLGRARGATRGPNFLLILADDMGFSDAGCYGGEIATPHLDALARRGLRFEQAYSTARCWPSRACLMTGYYAQQVNRDGIPGIPGGEGGGQGKQPAWAPMISQRLRGLSATALTTPANGTSMAGRWTMAGTSRTGWRTTTTTSRRRTTSSTMRSSRRSSPTAGTTAAPPSPTTSSAACRDTPRTTRPSRSWATSPSPCPTFRCRPCRTTSTATATGTCSVGTRSAAGAGPGSGARGSLNCALSAPCPEVFPKWNVKPEDIPAQLGPGEVQTYQPWDTLNETQRRYLATKMAIHAAMVTRMDTEIGRVVDQLKAMGEFDNTVIVFASDNGASAEQMIRGDGHDLSAPLGSDETFSLSRPGLVHRLQHPVPAPQGVGPRRRDRLAVDRALAAGHPRSRRRSRRSVPPPWIAPDLDGPRRRRLGRRSRRPALPVAQSRAGATRQRSVGHEVLWWSHETNRALRFGDWKIVHDQGPWGCTTSP